MRKVTSLLFPVIFITCGLAACGSTKPAGGHEGGTGGNNVGSGGFVGTGGGSATGGATSTGGVASGGAGATGGVGSGGTTATGGAAATGGTTATGGTGTGGAATGGTTSTGGSATGGAPAGGAGGFGAGAGFGGGGGSAGGAGGIGAAGGMGGSGSCPADGSTLNTGCANQALNATIASVVDDGVLSCQTVGTCKYWTMLTNCDDQSLTAGTDAVTHLPACVCKPAGSAPGMANTLYVDPDPPRSTFMANPATGALQPPACRLRRLREALAVTNTTFTRVVAVHQTDNLKHHKNEFKDLLTDTYSAAPLIVPPGVELTTDSVGSNGTAPANIYLFGGDSPRVVLSIGSKLSGFVLVGTRSETASEGITFNAEILGCSSGATSVSDLYIVGTGTGTAQTGIHISGTCALTASRVSIRSVARGVVVDPSASFSGTEVGGVP